MPNEFWMLAGFGPVLCSGTAIVAARRRRGRPGASGTALTRSGGYGSAGKRPTLDIEIESAERQLGMLLRRMRAYRRAPYDFAASRISNDADFERCLDLATTLSMRIEELSGAAVVPAERIRDQLLQSLSSRDMASGDANR
jgi:hypothetical protein